MVKIVLLAALYLNCLAELEYELIEHREGIVAYANTGKVNAAIITAIELEGNLRPRMNDKVFVYYPDKDSYKEKAEPALWTLDSSLNTPVNT